MTKQKPERITPDQSPPAAAPASNGVEPTPAPAQEPDHKCCFRCGKGASDFLGALTWDRFGFLLHASCRRVVEAEAAPWKR
jgi:hypothetical protein